MKISLRGRVLLWYAITVPLLIFAIVFTAQHVMVANLRSSLDDGLHDRAEIVSAAIAPSLDKQNPNYRELIRQAIDQQFSTLPQFVRLTDPQGRLITGFGAIPSTILPNLETLARDPQASDGHFNSVKIKGTESLRVYTLGLRDPASGQVIVILQTADSLATVRSAEGRLLFYSILIGTLGSLATLAIGFLMITRSFRPLERILDRVKEMERKSLHAGLPEEPRPPELQQLANSLNNMWQRLDAAFKLQQDFVASVSHDLRTPLAALRGQIDVMLMEPSLSTEVKESLERMRLEIRRLDRMTSDLLLYAQLEAQPPLAASPVDLKELLEDVHAQVWVLAQHLELSLVTPESVIVSGDADLLKQLVLNIVDNAIKFTPRDGKVELRLGKEDDWAALQVSDTGRGIPAEQLQRVTEAFYQVKGTDRSLRRGAGLGLAIVKQITRLHHGELAIQSLEGKGTTVTVRLPLLKGPDPRRQTELQRESVPVRS